MGTPLKPAEAAERLFPATEPDGAHRVEPLPPAASPSPSSPQFRRAFPRIPCRVLVDYVVDGKAYRDCIANISEGGAFIETCHPLRAGRPITLSFTLFQDQQPLRVAGEVVWSDATGAGVRLQPNATIGQYCAKRGDQAGVAVEGPDAEAAQTPLAAGQPEGVRGDHHAASRNAVLIVALFGVIFLTAMAILFRYDTRAEILALGEKVDRSSQNLARIEAAVAKRLEGAYSAPAPPPDAARADAARGAKTPPSQNASAAGRGQTAPVTAYAAADPSPAQAPSQETTYTVQPGDTLYRIGLKFNLSPKALLDFNQLASADTIYVGQRLRIPAANGR